MLLAELGLLPLQVFWWRQTLKFWNSLAALPVGSFYHAVCLGNLSDALRGGACNLSSSLASCLHLVGYDMPRVQEVDNIVWDLTEQLQGMGSGALYCPRVAPTRGVVSCTYEQWFGPYSLRRRYCHLPVSGRRMCRFLRLRLGCHGLPVAAGRFAGAAHVDRAERVCLFCDSGAVGDERHLVFNCVALAPLRSQHTGLFTSNTDTMGSFGLEVCRGQDKFSRGQRSLEVFAISLPRSSNSVLSLRKVCGNVLRSSMRPDRAPTDTSEGLSCLTCSDEGATRPLVDKSDKANLT